MNSEPSEGTVFLRFRLYWPERFTALDAQKALMQIEDELIAAIDNAFNALAGQMGLALDIETGLDVLVVDSDSVWSK